LSYSVNISALPQGFHLLVYRARDDMGRWSVGLRQVFYVFRAQGTTDSKITRAEYFIDTDPGFGSAVNIPIATPAGKLELAFNVDISSLTQAFHMIMLRTRDNTGRWSTANQQVFYVFKAEPATTSNVTAIEYFLDTDPGFGKGTIYNIPAPGKKVEATFTVSLSGVTAGNHVVYFRARDAAGRWGQMYSHAFTSSTTDIGDMEVRSWFRMYPNPGAGDFIIDFSEMPERPVMLTISDMSGRVVFTNALEGERIQMSVDLPSGIYMVAVKAGNKSFNQKLLISR